MTDTVVFADEQGYADFVTFVGRAKAADPEGAMRLQASGQALAAYVGVLPGSGVMAAGAVVGLRVMPLAVAAHVDQTVSLASLADRLARPGQHVTVSLPPVTVRAGWAAVSPPRSGWEPVGTLSSESLVAAAEAGIAEIATGVGEPAGAHAVAALRQRVWARSTATTPPVPAGAAFAAYALGFLEPGAQCTVLAHGRWARLSTRRGHVLTR